MLVQFKKKRFCRKKESTGGVRKQSSDYQTVDPRFINSQGKSEPLEPRTNAALAGLAQSSESFNM